MPVQRLNRFGLLVYIACIGFFTHSYKTFLSLHLRKQQALSLLSSSPAGPMVVGGGQARRPAVIDGGAAAKNSFFFPIFFDFYFIFHPLSVFTLRISK